jgi:hypothetical protein
MSEKDDMELPEKGNGTAPNGHPAPRRRTARDQEPTTDMQRPPAHTETAEPSEGFDALLEGFIPRRAIVTGERAGRELRCAASGHLGGGCRCELAIPEHVVVEAWARERSFGNSDDRFFRVFWRDEVWLAYGATDGGVRGVHCPDHRAAREERAFGLGSAVEATSKELAPV